MTDRALSIRARFRDGSGRTLPVVLAALLLGAAPATLPAGAAPPSLQVSSSTTFDAEELCIVIDPSDPTRVVAGANIAYVYTSDDRGQGWNEQVLESSLGVWGDPSLTFDADGNLFYAHLSYPRTYPGSWLDRIVVQKSIDGGVNWSDGVGVGLNGSKDQDKEWIEADRTDSPHRHNLYMAWTEFDSYGSAATNDSTRILFARSIDRGETWSSPLRISDLGGNCIDADLTVEGATPAVGPNGEVYLAWSGHDQIWFDRSLDGGVGFGADRVIATQPGGWDFAVPGLYRANGLPVTKCDVSASPYRGRIYVVFSDQRNGVDDTDVFLVKSDDGGDAWSTPRRVNDDVGARHQFFPWLSVDPVTGTVAVVFYDRRDTVGDATDVFVAISTDGGDTFENLRVSDASFTPWDSVFFGDYIGVDARDGFVHTIWMAMDGGDLSVWTARLAEATAVSSTGWGRAEPSLVMRVPAVATSQRTKISFTSTAAGPVDLSIYDIRGRHVQTLVREHLPAGSFTEAWDARDASGSVVASGMYFVRLQIGQDVVTEKVSVVK